MVAKQQSDYWGVGIYSLADAARLTGVNAQRIRRWVRGYEYQAEDESRSQRPVWSGQLPTLDDEVALGFLDLMEVRFVKAFIDRGVSLQSVRRAAARAKAFFETDHALCTNYFVTDGRTILAEVGEAAGEQKLLDLVKNQYAFKRILKPYLHGLEFDDDFVARWWPLGEQRSVVLDPDRSFGAPIASRSGVPTAVLAKAYQREDDLDRVARWYEVTKKEVKDAVQFETKLAA